MIKYIIALTLVLSIISHNEHYNRFRNPNPTNSNWHSLNWQGGSLGKRSRGIADQWNTHCGVIAVAAIASEIVIESFPLRGIVVVIRSNCRVTASKQCDK